MKQYRISIRLPYDPVDMMQVFEVVNMADLYRQIDNFVRMHFDGTEYEIVGASRCDDRIAIMVEDVMLNWTQKCWINVAKMLQDPR